MNNKQKSITETTNWMIRQKVKIIQLNLNVGTQERRLKSLSVFLTCLRLSKKKRLHLSSDLSL